MAKKYIYILLYYVVNNSVNELRRQAYLEAMGIQVYYSHATLPGAKPSSRYEPAEKSSVSGKRAEDSSKYAAIEQQKSNQREAQAKAAQIDEDSQKVRTGKLEVIQFGRHEYKTWYQPPFPQHLQSCSKLYICHLCLKVF